MTHGRPGRAIRSRRKGRAAETRPGFVDGYTGSSHLQKTQTAGPAPRRAENLSLSSGICYFDLAFGLLGSASGRLTSIPRESVV